MATQIERNARMVVDLLPSDWRMAYIIACSVKNDGRGKPVNRADANKVPMSTFAEMVKKAAGGRVYGLSPKAIASILIRWDALAAEEVVWDRSELTPENANEDVEFPDYSFRAATDTGKGNLASISRSHATIAEALEDPAVAAAVAAKASPKAKRNIAVAAMDQQTLDDPMVKSKVRGQVAQHDETASKASRGESKIEKGFKDGMGTFTNSHLMESFGEFQRFAEEVKSGKWVINDRDASVIDRFITLMASVAANVKFEEVGK
jgi:hypothetical protein